MNNGTDLTKPVVINSVYFPEAYLFMDGSDVKSKSDNGAGKVTCCSHFLTPIGQPEKAAIFNLRPQPDGSYAIESAKYPGVYLRMNSSGFTSPNGNGGGQVNCQLGIGAWEKFRLIRKPEGYYGIESVAFPGNYLRMDGKNPNKAQNGFGIINCQRRVDNYERFYLLNVPSLDIHIPTWN